MEYKIKKLKKKDYLEVIKLIKEIKNTGFAQKNINEFMKGKSDFVDVILNAGLDFMEVLGEEQIQKELDKFLIKTIEGISQEKLDDLDLDEYIELVIEWFEVQGLMGFIMKYFPSLNIEEILI